MYFFDQEIFLFLGVKTGGHDQLHDRRKLLLFLLLFWFLEVDIHAKSALRHRGKQHPCCCEDWLIPHVKAFLHSKKYV